MLLSKAVLPLKIAVAKIKLTLGRNYHNTFHHSLMTDRVAQAALGMELCLTRIKDVQGHAAKA